MPRWSTARLLGLTALLVVLILDGVLFAHLPREIKASLFLPHAAATPRSTPTPAPTPASTPTPTPYRPVPITAAYDNVGIGLDGTSSADFDGFGFSYSEQALTAAQLGPGAAASSGGVRYVMPSIPPGHRDNIKASGQTILAPSLPGATLLGFLGAGSGGDASGTVKITYTDGTTQTGTLAFSDWTLGGGTESLQPGAVVLAASAYRDIDGSQDQTKTYVFASVPIHLQTGKAIERVRLPNDVTGGTMHVFSIGTDKGSFS
ncbi:MAG: hypothetical protein J2P38_00630 [Candidatus Dormibacteraeota bacterium]|nr:hypothetical protein [Candidatus Dormibacteraeota bacterium]